MPPPTQKLFSTEVQSTISITREKCQAKYCMLWKLIILSLVKSASNLTLCLLKRFCTKLYIKYVCLRRKCSLISCWKRLFRNCALAQMFAKSLCQVLSIKYHFHKHIRQRPTLEGLCTYEVYALLTYNVFWNNKRFS
jgi:hypothetical protein